MRLHAFASIVVGVLMLVSANGCVYPFGSRSKNAENPAEHFDYNYAGKDWASRNNSQWQCAGNRQSPMLLRVRDQAPKLATIRPSTFNYGVLDSSDMDLQMLNNGHTFLLNFPNASMYQANVTIAVQGSNKTLVDAFEKPSGSINTVSASPIQLHFHARSEHVVDGVMYPAEMHIVHSVSQDKWPACPTGGCLLVLGILFHLTDNSCDAIPALDRILKYAPMQEDAAVMITGGLKIDLDSLLPKSRDHVVYSGSLTTPPCTEGILWHVMTESMPMTNEQLIIMMEAMGDSDCGATPLISATGRPFNVTNGTTGGARRLFAEEADDEDAYKPVGPDGCRKLADAHNFRDIQPPNDRPVKMFKTA